MDRTRAPQPPRRRLLDHVAARYSVAVIAVAIAFAVRKVLEPLTGSGAPFVLFAGAVLITSIVAGARAGIVAALLSIPLGVHQFVARAGYSVSQASYQALLYGVDVFLIVYLTHLATRARHESRRFAERTRAIIALTPDAFFQADLQGRLTDVNEAACRLLGYARDELVGMRILDLLPPADEPRYQAARQQLLTQGRVSITEWSLERKDGTSLILEVSSNILPDGKWQAFARDITEHERAERERQADLDAMERLHRVGSLFLGERPAQAILYEILDSAIAIAGSDFGSIQVFDPESSHLEVVAHRGFPEWWLEYWRRVSKGHGSCGTALLRGERVIVEDILQSPIFAGSEALEIQTKAGIRAVQSTPLVGRSGTVVGMVSTHWRSPQRLSDRVLRLLDLLARQAADIIERAQSEEALRVMEARSSGILATSADAIVSIDEQYRITLFNQGAEKIFGYTREEAIGASLDILIPERLRAAHRQHVARFAAGPVAARRVLDRVATIVGRRKNGEEFPADAAISKLEVHGRNILTVTVRDATERVRAEEQQRFLAEAGAVLSSSLDYEQTLTTVGQLVVRAFADWCIVDLVEPDGGHVTKKVVCADESQAPLCRELERVRVDRSRPHLVGRALQTGRPELIERVTAAHLEACAQSPEHLRLLQALDARSAMQLPLRARGELLGALVLISSRRTYEADDLRFAEALAERAALAIENGRLYRQAVRATTLRDEVLGVVAHDLKNPLAAIRMQSEILRSPHPDPERRNRKSSQVIERAASRMSRLIRDLVDVSAMEAGQLGIDRSRLSPGQLLGEALEVQRPLAASGSLDVRLELEGDLPDVWGDAYRLLEVLENLIGNATKFTPPGGRIVVGAAPREHDVLFRVTDTGCGIPAEALPRVFDRFWQAKHGDRKGAGLGLSIARGIVEAHDGRIWVESTPGRGTTFYFTIPRAVTPTELPAGDAYASR